MPYYLYDVNLIEWKKGENIIQIKVFMPLVELLVPNPNVRC